MKMTDLMISESVDRDGFIFIGITDSAGGHVFSFTIGLKASFDLPEVVFLGTRDEADLLVSRMLNYRGIGLTTEEMVGMVDIDGEALRYCLLDDDIKSKIIPQVKAYYASIGYHDAVEVIWIGRISDAYPFDAIVNGSESIPGVPISKLNH